MRSSTPFAAWLKTFLAPPSGRVSLLHVGQSPSRRRSIVAVRRWSRAYPFRAVSNPNEYAQTLHRLRTESGYLSYMPWVFDPEVWLTLTGASLEYLATAMPLIPGDLNLPLKSARLLGVPTPTEIGPAAPTFALILYLFASITAPLRRFRTPQARLIDQLLASVQRRLESASPADLVAIHVLMRRLLALRGQRWARRALDVCLPLSPLTWLLEDSTALSGQAPRDWRGDWGSDWRGIEVVLSGFCLDGLQTRCSQRFVEMMIPGWDWHTAEDPVRFMRFRSASALFNRLTWALDNAGQPVGQPGIGPIQALRLAAWILRTYRLLGRSLDVYQRIALPPPVNPAAPDQIPSFRMLRQFLPVDPRSVQEWVGELAAPIRPVMSLLVEASRITSTPIYLSEGLPAEIVAIPLPTNADVGVMLAAQQLIAAWEAMGPYHVALMGNLYQFVLKSQREA